MADESPSAIREKHRKQVWDDLRGVARPDSRFAWDFAEFIADYEGSEQNAQRIRELAGDLDITTWFVTPDNNLDKLRESLVRDNIPFVMPSYGILRGFLSLHPEDVPAGDERFVGTLDGMNRYASPIPFGELADRQETFDILVTGSSFVTTDGLRMGKGHGFFDLEWAMLREVDLVDHTTKVVAVAHDVQVIDADEIDRDSIIAEHDTIADYIVTPTTVHEIQDAPPKPTGIHWNLLAEEKIERIPPLAYLSRQHDGEQ